MKRLVLITLLLVASLALAIILSIWKGLQEQTIIAVADAFTNPDGAPCKSPCMFGIQLGKTSFSDAKLMLYRHSLTQGVEGPYSLSSPGTWYEFQNSCISVILMVDDRDIVKRVRLSQTKKHQKIDCKLDLSKETLGTTVSVLGEPDYVYIERGTNLVYIYYLSYRVWIQYIRFSYANVQKYMYKNRLHIKDQLDYLEIDYDNDPEPQTSPWLGFIHVDTYLENMYQ